MPYNHLSLSVVRGLLLLSFHKRQGATLDRLLVYHRASERLTNTHTHKINDYAHAHLVVLAARNVL